MRYRDLSIQTLREAPNNARTEGFAFLVQAGYLTREYQPTALGQHTLKHLSALMETAQPYFEKIKLPVITNEDETFFEIQPGDIEIIHCSACGYASRSETAIFTKVPLPDEELLPYEKITTPDCNTIESLAAYFDIPKTKTAKALLFTRSDDEKLVFAVVRGDRSLSEFKLKAGVGEVRPATDAEIIAAGAVPGYASPVGLENALIIVDDLIPHSVNLVAGANLVGYHLKNINYGRDYKADIITDLVQAQPGDACLKCNNPLVEIAGEILQEQDRYYFENILLSLSETYHDENGLTLPKPAAPFDVYLMHIPGKVIDTLAAAVEIDKKLREAGISVLFDDREARAGVKFNDADLIGCPVRVTVGERGLKEGVVELKSRTAAEKELVLLAELVDKIKTL